jgi:hypothetical protein
MKNFQLFVYLLAVPATFAANASQPLYSQALNRREIVFSYAGRPDQMRIPRYLDVENALSVARDV